MLLEKKTTAIYGAAGGVGSGVARAFAREGAQVFLAGRTSEPLTALADEIRAAGGSAEPASVDALDESAVEAHLESVVASSGKIDVTLNLIPRGDVQGIPLVDMSPDDVVRAVDTGLRSNFLTARAAARHMIAQGSGVILGLNSGSAHGSPMMGSTGPADAALDTLFRNLSLELGSSGVRVCGLWVAGIPETLTVEKLRTVNAQIPWDEGMVEDIKANLASMRSLRRSPSLAEIASAAVFLASDQSSGMTGTWLNVTGGIFTS